MAAGAGSIVPAGRAGTVITMAWSLLAVLLMLVAVAGLCWWPDSQPDGPTVAEIRQRIERESREAVHSGAWYRDVTHHPPARALTLAQAHRAMQYHRNCEVGHCPRKTAAWRTLRAAGRVIPDSGRAGAWVEVGR